MAYLEIGEQWLYAMPTDDVDHSDIGFWDIENFQSKKFVKYLFSMAMACPTSLPLEVLPEKDRIECLLIPRPRLVDGGRGKNLSDDSVFQLEKLSNNWRSFFLSI